MLVITVSRVTHTTLVTDFLRRAAPRSAASRRRRGHRWVRRHHRPPLLLRPTRPGARGGWRREPCTSWLLVDGAAPAAAPPAVAPPAAEIAIVSVAASPTDDAPLELRAAGHAPSSLCSPVGGSPSNGVPAAAASTGAASRHWPPRAAQAADASGGRSQTPVLAARRPRAARSFRRRPPRWCVETPPRRHVAPLPRRSQRAAGRHRGGRARFRTNCTARRRR